MSSKKPTTNVVHVDFRRDSRDDGAAVTMSPERGRVVVETEVPGVGVVSASFDPDEVLRVVMAAKGRVK